MKTRNFVTIIASIGAVIATMPQAWASVVLNFAGLNGTSEEGPGSYYDGGYGSLGSGPGPNYGITFGSDAITCSGRLAGGCNTELIPGGPGANAVYFVSGTGDVMDVSAGFTNGFSFYYTSPNDSGTVDVYSGLDGTGTLLASLTLPTTTDGADQPGCDGTDFCPYTAFGVTFSGTAESVDFSGVENQIAFADITLGSAEPGTVPEPASWALLGAGLAVLALGCTRRRRLTRRAI